MKVLITRILHEELLSTSDDSLSSKFFEIDKLSWGQLSRWRHSRKIKDTNDSNQWIFIRQFDCEWEQICVWTSLEAPGLETLRTLVDQTATVTIDRGAFKESELDLLIKNFSNNDTRNSFTKDSRVL